MTSGVDQSRTAHGYDRPNVAGGVNSALPGDQRSPAEWFNASVFQMNPLGTFGNIGRSTLTGPGSSSSIFLPSRTSRLAPEICSSGSNVQSVEPPELRRPEHEYGSKQLERCGANGVPTVGGDSFGTISETRATVPMRELQFALKLGF